MADTLVVYYSRRGENFMPGGVQVLEKGNTEYAAEFIRDAVGANLFRLETVREYPEDYRACCKEAAEEARSGARPELKAYPPDVSGYKTVFVCYPNWCGTAPMCVFTFLERYGFAGVRIAPLCTNEGSGLAHSEADIAAACPEAILLPGLSLRGHQAKDSREAVVAWARGCLE